MEAHSPLKEGELAVVLAFEKNRNTAARRVSNLCLRSKPLNASWEFSSEVQNRFNPFVLPGEASGFARVGARFTAPDYYAAFIIEPDGSAALESSGRIPWVSRAIALRPVALAVRINQFWRNALARYF